MAKIYFYSFFVVIFLWCFGTGYSQMTTDAAATGISRAFNPAISVNCLFDAMGTNRNDVLWSEIGLEPGLHYQEICMEMTANVDVYLQSKVALSVEEKTDLGVEEAYASTLRMPIPLILRMGKMLNTFGRHNLLHLHHMAFVERPMILEQVFGPDLNEMSIEGAYLLPLPWYSDAIAGILNGDNPNLFEGSSKGDVAFLAHWDNLWDVTDEWTVRIGGSYLRGERGLPPPENMQQPLTNNGGNVHSGVWGANIHLKWKPLHRGRYHSFTLQGEYVNAKVNMNGNSTEPLHGFFIQMLGQFNIRWFIQARYDWFNRPQELHLLFPAPINFSFNPSEDLQGQRLSFCLAFVPTEFSAYRLQYNYIDLGGQGENQIIAQLNITIGSHPAHKY